MLPSVLIRVNIGCHYKDTDNKTPTKKMTSIKVYCPDQWDNFDPHGPSGTGFL